MDVHKAFDHMELDILEKALGYHKIPVPLRAAFSRELLHNKATIHVQGITSELVDLSRRGKQGDTCIPVLWNIYLSYVFHAATEEWKKTGAGIDLHDGHPPISHFIWADDVWTIADEVDTAATTYGSADRALCS